MLQIDQQTSQTINWILTTIASVSALLNVMFLKGVLGDIKSLRESRHEHAQWLAVLRADVDWLKHHEHHRRIGDRPSGDHHREE